MQNFIWALLGLAIVPQALAADTLSTNGFNLCMTNSAINVQKMDVTYTRSSGVVVFDVAGTNAKQQKVQAAITVTAYGNEIYSKEFDPCGDEIHVEQLCPVPKGTFKASGSMEVPAEYASQIPGIAFKIPDLDGQAKLVLKSKENNNNVACIESHLSNGHSAEVGAVKYVSAGIAAGALALSGVSALGSAGSVGTPSSSPGFGDVMGLFHSMATNGMLSVSYPPIYRSFSSNFLWSTGLIPWPGMLQSIDKFREATGGNLTTESYDYLKKASIARSSSSSTNTTNTTSTNTKRSWDYTIEFGEMVPRSIEASADPSVTESSSDSKESGSSDSEESSSSSTVSDMKQLAQDLMVPSADIFMTVLLIFAIVIAVVVVGILLMKVVLELWALYGNFPNKLSDFRKDYWGLMARTITNMILVLYSIWVLYCVYQLRKGDSWAAKTLAAITLSIFTAVLLFFAVRIVYMARKYKKAEGDTSRLYEDKETWKKYSLFYDNYKKDFWWLFIPVMVYALVKGCIIAGGEGHGLFQSAGQLACEILLLGLLVWSRPYATKASMGINIAVQVVRVLSIVCVLVFVEELGLSQTTKTVTGVVLIVVQSTLTAVLAILIAVNAIINCCRENPHEKRRREAEKANRDLDDLTPLDARDSLLMDHPQRKEYAEMSNFNFTGPYESYRDEPKRDRPTGSDERDGLVRNDYGVAHGRSNSPDSHHSRSSLEGRRPAAPGYGMAY
ncbi:TRP-like family [Penicillium griseofulvum]|uniref:TRP-like family n=1 Tax=Penicillium patulum TaxID=5078 RepID=A0A135LPU7_PENPA|nr:TRP-like family [Penicillium griseofulvum]KXG50983.1 TRP-like family [Penicillium griseofulvum]